MNDTKSQMNTHHETLGQSSLTSGPLAAPAFLSSNVFAANSTTLRVGLVGCGGRGTGAAGQALQADPNVELVAMGDAFAEQIQPSLQSLKTEGTEKGFAARIKVTPETCFSVVDA